MPRIQMTKTARLALGFLLFYLIFLLALILVRFIRTL